MGTSSFRANSLTLGGGSDTATADGFWLVSSDSDFIRLASDFGTRTWGYAKLTDLLKAHPGNEVVSRSPGNGKPKVSVLRSKPRT